MKDIPIIFSGPMVRALLADRKTMTRRLAWRPARKGADAGGVSDRIATPWQRVRPGDRLWVRENLCQHQGEFLGIKQSIVEARYAADEAEVLNEHGFNLLPWWKGNGGLPSIHMPGWASRLTLTVTAVKLERLQDISEADAEAEGVYTGADGDLGPLDISARALFADLWRSLHGSESAAANPFVVAMTFRVIKANINAPAATRAAA